MKSRTGNRRFQKRTHFLLITVVVALLVNFIRLPLYVTYPGEAEALDRMISVEDGYADDGDFMLTTIRIGKANLVQTIWASLSEYQYLLPENHVQAEWENDEEYFQRQLQMMDHSQQSALIVAYRMTNKPLTVTNEGVIVSGLIPGMPAGSKLEVGDVIKKVDGQAVGTAEALLQLIEQKEQGDVIDLVIERQGDEKKVSLTVAPFPESYRSDGGKKAGIGIVGPVTKRSIETNPPVTFHTDGIGGPSAGLMFALEIYNQLTETDLTKGYAIAGTGEINEDGSVGAIGGIKQKVVAANRAGADMFFAPVAGGNAEEAKEAASDIRTDMEIVPVETFRDAVEYLKGLKNAG